MLCCWRMRMEPVFCGPMWLTTYPWIARSRALACLVAGFALLVGLVSTSITYEGAQATTRLAPNYLRVEIDDDYVTIVARDVPVRDIIDEITRQSALWVFFHAPVDKHVTLTVHRRPLPEVLSLVLSDHIFALDYTRPTSSLGNSNRARPGELLGYSRGQKDNVWHNNDAESSPSSASTAVEVRQPGRMRDAAQPEPDARGGSTALAVEEKITALTLALADADKHLRIDAVSTLADIGTDQAAEALAMPLGDEDPEVREQAVEALGAIGGETAIQLIEQAFNDAEKHVRRAAIEALDDIGGEESTRALAIALHDEDAALREEAVYALGDIGGETAIHLLWQAVTDQNSSIREAATELLAELSSGEQ